MKEKNIKKDRLSHSSSPIDSDTEFHLRDEEIGTVPDDGEEGYVCFPVKTVNHGDDSGIMMHRFVQTGKATFHYDLKDPKGLQQKLRSASDKARNK